MAGGLCQSCSNGNIISDPDTEFLICDYCGEVHDSNVFQHQLFDTDGRPLGSRVSAGDFGYLERKLHNGSVLISEITSRLGLSVPHAADVYRLASQATNGELGSGEWFPLLIAACSVIVMRRHHSPLSLAEAAAAVASDPHDLGHMVARVVQQLDIGQLPELDAIRLLERTVLNFPPFSNLEKDRSTEILGQGRFLLHCAMRWFLTTGRHPLPIVASVLAFVAKVNGVNISMEEIAKEIHANVNTCRSRVRELIEVLVRVAKVLLPWGNDVTTKNIVHNAPVLIRFMELKSRYKSNQAEEGDGHLQDTSFNLADILNTFSEYGGVAPEESKYFNLEDDDVTVNQMLGFDKLKRLKLSATEICLSHSYESVLDRLPGFSNKSQIGANAGTQTRRTGLEIEDWIESWQGRWESDKGLTVDQILERCEGYDALPPSFINGIDMQRRRKVKIEAAKNRILKTMKRAPTIGVMAPIGDGDEKLSKHLPYRKRRRSNRAIDGIDWEDCIIELLLLHQVDEEEIEQGQYNRLLDLHVFYSSDVEALRGMAKCKLSKVNGSHSTPS